MEKKILKLRDLNDDESLKLRELMETHGGEDEDEDCYFSQCFISTNTCTSNVQDCYFIV